MVDASSQLARKLLSDFRLWSPEHFVLCSTCIVDFYAMTNPHFGKILTWVDFQGLIGNSCLEETAIVTALVFLHMLERPIFQIAYCSM